MDNFNFLLCDELIQEILQRLPSPSSPFISLVCKRWLFLHRDSKTSLSVRIPHCAGVSCFSSILSHHPSLHSLTVVPNSPEENDNLLLCVCSNCPNLSNLRFLSGPVSSSSLRSLADSCKHLTSLGISSFRPGSFTWLTSFPCLKHLSIIDCRGCFEEAFEPVAEIEDGYAELPMESLCLSGIGAGDLGFGWLWRSCKKLRKLQLRSCEGTGDGSSFSSFVTCLSGLLELELRTCRSMVDGLLIRMAEHCSSLTSLILYDGGSHDALLWFLTQCRSPLRHLDLRLPLDLDDDHLSAIAENLGTLCSLRLQSCCLISGNGLRLLGPSLSTRLEELALINCDVVERELGLLTSMGQSLRRIRKLDLSYNDMLLDKELGSMLASCNNLVEIRLRGCRSLTNSVIGSLRQSFHLLEFIDIMQCHGICADAVELLIQNFPRLSRVLVEENKLSDDAKTWAALKAIQFY